MRAIALTCTHSIANSTRKRKRTQITACKRSLRLTRGRFLRANAIAFCALDCRKYFVYPFVEQEQKQLCTPYFLD